jgi:hypothetical protein
LNKIKVFDYVQQKRLTTLGGEEWHPHLYKPKKGKRPMETRPDDDLKNGPI